VPRFEYGPTTSYGSVVASSPPLLAQGSTAAVSAVVRGLTCGTRYYFRALAASNTRGTTYGAEETFVTGACETAPYIAPLLDKATRRNTSTSVMVTVSGGSAGPAALVVSARSSNQALVPDSGLI